MLIRVDIDDTICGGTGANLDYSKAKPWPQRIAQINRMYDEGHEIIYWTSRGQRTGQNWFERTTTQLISWGCKYHALQCTKPYYDVFVDDKSFNAVQNFDGFVRAVKFNTNVSIESLYQL
jgi:hypothetical protein